MITVAAASCWPQTKLELRQGIQCELLYRTSLAMVWQELKGPNNQRENVSHPHHGRQLRDFGARDLRFTPTNMRAGGVNVPQEVYFSCLAGKEK